MSDIHVRPEVVDRAGDRLDVIMDSGIQRGTHIVKALSLGAKAVGIGRAYLFPLAAAGQAGVERMVGLLKDEVERDMRLPVRAYIVVISTMLTLAFAAWSAGASHLLLLGALSFYVSDLAVARDRFVRTDFFNRLWGLPAYYLGQLCLALCVLGLRSV